MPPEETGGRERAASNSGRPIQIGTSHRAYSLKVSTLETATAPSHPPVEDAEVVNRRQSFLDAEEQKREEVVEEEEINSMPVSARLKKWESGDVKAAAASDDKKQEKPPVAAASASIAAASPAPSQQSAEPPAEEPWSAVDILTLGVSRLLTPRGSSSDVK